MDKARYTALMDAARILAKARVAIGKEDDYMGSPPWNMVADAWTYITKQADREMRGTDEVSLRESK
jgi:hypothetical protein